MRVAVAPFGFLVACLLSGLLAPSTALANPVPDYVVLMNAHGDDGGSFCDQAGTDLPACEDVIGATSLTGAVAFDFIAHGNLCMLEEDTIQFTIEWPAEWGFIRGEACGTGASVVPTGNHAVFSVSSLEGAPVDEWAPCFGALGRGRLVLDVTSEGMVRCSQAATNNWWSEGWAGVQCGRCVTYHCWGEPPRPELVPEALELTAHSGGHADGSFHVQYRGYESGGNLDFEFHASAPWISIDAVRLGEPCCPEYDVTVDADATGLEPGVHEGWIEVHTSWCHECERVTLTVEGSPSPVLPESWGALKTRFR